jgi:hypothetical protein
VDFHFVRFHYCVQVPNDLARFSEIPNVAIPVVAILYAVFPNVVIPVVVLHILAFPNAVFRVLVLRILAFLNDLAHFVAFRRSYAKGVLFSLDVLREWVAIRRSNGFLDAVHRSCAVCGRYVA